MFTIVIMVMVSQVYTCFLEIIQAFSSAFIGHHCLFPCPWPFVTFLIEGIKNHLLGAQLRTAITGWDDVLRKIRTPKRLVTKKKKKRLVVAFSSLTEMLLRKLEGTYSASHLSLLVSGRLQAMITLPEKW